MDLTYRHFKIGPELLMCDWSGQVATIEIHENASNGKIVRRCAKCMQEVRFNGPTANVVSSNSPHHLGHSDRVELYKRKNWGAVLNYYHPLRNEFQRDFGYLATEKRVS